MASIVTKPERGSNTTGVVQPTTVTTATHNTTALPKQQQPTPPPGLQVKQQITRLPKKVSLTMPIVLSVIADRLPLPDRIRDYDEAREYPIKELWVNPVISSNVPPWMVDSGAATHVVPLWFADRFPLLPPTEHTPPLQDAQDNVIQHHGERWIGLKLHSGSQVAIQAIVADVSGPILSTSKLEDCGFDVQLTKRRITSTYDDQFLWEITRDATHYWAWYEDFCPIPDQICPISSFDDWMMEGDHLVRKHCRQRRSLFKPTDTEELPEGVTLENIGSERVTSRNDVRGKMEIVRDHWHTRESKKMYADYWTGETRFKHYSSGRADDDGYTTLNMDGPMPVYERDYQPRRTTHAPWRAVLADGTVIEGYGTLPGMTAMPGVASTPTEANATGARQPTMVDSGASSSAVGEAIYRGRRTRPDIEGAATALETIPLDQLQRDMHGLHQSGSGLAARMLDHLALSSSSSEAEPSRHPSIPEMVREPQDSPETSTSGGSYVGGSRDDLSDSNPWKPI